jgi:hypothetical protein
MAANNAPRPMLEMFLRECGAAARAEAAYLSGDRKKCRWRRLRRTLAALFALGCFLGARFLPRRLGSRKLDYDLAGYRVGEPEAAA